MVLAVASPTIIVAYVIGCVVSMVDVGLRVYDSDWKDWRLNWLIVNAVFFPGTVLAFPAAWGCKLFNTAWELLDIPIFRN